MLYQPYILIIILVLAMALFIWGKWQYDIVALVALFLAVISGCVPFHDIYSGLNNPAVITVACVMILSNTINQSGLFQILLRHTHKLTHNKYLYISTLTTITAVLSAFMNNIGAMAIIMPLAIHSSRKAKISPALILMPIALGSAMGGLTTLIGTPPNLLISSYRQAALGQPFAMFSFGKVGIFIAIAGVIYISLIGWKLIPKKHQKKLQTDEMFEITDYITEAVVTDKSPLVDCTLNQTYLKKWGEFNILGVIRDQKKRMSLNHEIIFQVGDILILEAAASDLNIILKNLQLELIPDIDISSSDLKEDNITLTEAIVIQSSRLEGRCLQDINLRSRYNTTVIAISRHGRVLKNRLNSTPLQVGDTLLIQGDADNLRSMLTRLKLLPLEQRDLPLAPTKKSYLSLLFFSLAIIISALQLAPVQATFGAAVFLNMIFRVAPIRNYYESIDWPVIILLAAMIPIGHAMQTTGGTTLIAHSLLSSTSHISPVLTLTVLMIVTMTLSDFMNNAATTVVMAPIAISLAQTLQVHIDPFLMSVAIGASCSFLTPIGHQNNTIIMSPGGYKFMDYIRVGSLLEVIVIVISIPAILYIWPL